ncbi:MAG: hypothetical protein HY909_18455 [Deltaproteobacteria bacterium]|nr:hypothetical protein [Deltaproteobacteria bacterium]
MTHHHAHGWEASYDAVAFTVDALQAHPSDHALARLATRIGGLLEDWESIDAAGRGLRRAALRSSAQCRAADGSLDAALGAFATALLAHVGGDTGASLYQKFFNEPHEDIIAMGLDSEVPLVTLVVSLLDSLPELTDALKAHTAPLRDALRLANGALANRSDALADLGRHGARVEAWQETAHSSLGSTRKALGRLAHERKLPEHWVASFFHG